MPSNRIGRINEEIQRELADQLRRLKDPRVSQVGMVSITRVDTTSDLRYARVYISVLDKDQEKDVLKGLKSAGGFLRRELGRALQLPSSTAPTSWRSCARWSGRMKPGTTRTPAKRRNEHADGPPDRGAAADL
mgnify:CR=1 FL=1